MTLTREAVVCVPCETKSQWLVILTNGVKLPHIELLGFIPNVQMFTSLITQVT